MLVAAVAIAICGAGCEEKAGVGGKAESLETVEGAGSVAELYAVGCADCHGAAGEGNNPKLVPAVAGLPDYYVVGELTKFQGLLRGMEPDAAGGALKMHGIASSMSLDLMQAMGAYLAGMRPVVSELTVAEGADLARGRKLYEAQCAECHGREAEGDPAKLSPPLYVFQDWYLVAQIEKFQADLRQSDPANVASLRMHATALQLAREEDVRDVAGFVVSRLTGQRDAAP